MQNSVETFEKRHHALSREAGVLNPYFVAKVLDMQDRFGKHSPAVMATVLENLCMPTWASIAAGQSLTLMLEKIVPLSDEAMAYEGYDPSINDIRVPSLSSQEYSRALRLVVDVFDRELGRSHSDDGIAATLGTLLADLAPRTDSSDDDSSDQDSSTDDAGEANYLDTIDTPETFEVAGEDVTVRWKVKESLTGGDAAYDPAFEETSMLGILNSVQLIQALSVVRQYKDMSTRRDHALKYIFSKVRRGDREGRTDNLVGTAAIYSISSRVAEAASEMSKNSQLRRRDELEIADEVKSLYALTSAQVITKYDSERHKKLHAALSTYLVDKDLSRDLGFVSLEQSLSDIVDVVRMRTAIISSRNGHFNLTRSKREGVDATEIILRSFSPRFVHVHGVGQLLAYFNGGYTFLTDGDITYTFSKSDLAKLIEMVKSVSNVHARGVLSSPDGVQPSSYERSYISGLDTIRKCMALGEEFKERFGESYFEALELHYARLADTSNSEVGINLGLEAKLREKIGSKECVAADKALDVIEGSEPGVTGRSVIAHLYKIAAQPAVSSKEMMNKLIIGHSAPNKLSDPLVSELELRKAIFMGARKNKRPLRLQDRQGGALGRRAPVLARLQASSVINADVDVPLDEFKYVTFLAKQTPYWSDKPFKGNVKPHIKDKKSAGDFLSKRSVMEVARDFVSMKAFREVVTKTKSDILTARVEDVEVILENFLVKWRASKHLIDLGDGFDMTKQDILNFHSKHPDHRIHVAVAIKFGEVQKRIGRAFYLAETGAKLFMSQVESNVRRIVDILPGVMIVKSERARQAAISQMARKLQWMTNLSIEELFPLLVSFDLSKFSQKYPHADIDLWGKIMSEIYQNPDYEHLSAFFLLSVVTYADDGGAFGMEGTKGCFEGFLNFMWTGGNAVKMNNALRKLGIKGSLAVFSDDGLLLLLLPTRGVTKDDLNDYIERLMRILRDSYKGDGIIFHMGKTLAAVAVCVFLGIRFYKGVKMTLAIKEVRKIGIISLETLSGVCGLFNNTMAQGLATFEADDSTPAGYILGYYRGLQNTKKTLLEPLEGALDGRRILLHHLLVRSAGGNRVPDLLSTRTTTSLDPTAEMVYDMTLLSRGHVISGAAIDVLKSGIRERGIVSQTEDPYGVDFGRMDVTDLHLTRSLRMIALRASMWDIPPDPRRDPSVRRFCEGLWKAQNPDPAVIQLLFSQLKCIREADALSKDTKSSTFLESVKPQVKRREMKKNRKIVAGSKRFLDTLLDQKLPPKSSTFTEAMEGVRSDEKWNSYRVPMRELISEAKEGETPQIEVTVYYNKNRTLDNDPYFAYPVRTTLRSTRASTLSLGISSLEAPASSDHRILTSLTTLVSAVSREGGDIQNTAQQILHLNGFPSTPLIPLRPSARYAEQDNKMGRSKTSYRLKTPQNLTSFLKVRFETAFYHYMSHTKFFDINRLKTFCMAYLMQCLEVSASAMNELRENEVYTMGFMVNESYANMETKFPHVEEKMRAMIVPSPLVARYNGKCSLNLATARGTVRDAIAEMSVQAAVDDVVSNLTDYVAGAYDGTEEERKFRALSNSIEPTSVLYRQASISIASEQLCSSSSTGLPGAYDNLTQTSRGMSALSSEREVYEAVVLSIANCLPRKVIRTLSRGYDVAVIDKREILAVTHLVSSNLRASYGMTVSEVVSSVSGTPVPSDELLLTTPTFLLDLVRSRDVDPETRYGHVAGNMAYGIGEEVGGFVTSTYRKAFSQILQAEVFELKRWGTYGPAADYECLILNLMKDYLYDSAHRGGDCAANHKVVAVAACKLFGMNPPPGYKSVSLLGNEENSPSGSSYCQELKSYNSKQGRGISAFEALVMYARDGESVARSVTALMSKWSDRIRGKIRIIPTSALSHRSLGKAAPGRFTLSMSDTEETKARLEAALAVISNTAHCPSDREVKSNRTGFRGEVTVEFPSSWMTYRALPRPAGLSGSNLRTITFNERAVPPYLIHLVDGFIRPIMSTGVSRSIYTEIGQNGFTSTNKTSRRALADYIKVSVGSSTARENTVIVMVIRAANRSELYAALTGALSSKAAPKCLVLRLEGDYGADGARVVSACSGRYRTVRVQASPDQLEASAAVDIICWGCCPKRVLRFHRVPDPRDGIVEESEEYAYANDFDMKSERSDIVDDVSEDVSLEEISDHVPSLQMSERNATSAGNRFSALEASDSDEDIGLEGLEDSKEREWGAEEAWDRLDPIEVPQTIRPLTDGVGGFEHSDRSMRDYGGILLFALYLSAVHTKNTCEALLGGDMSLLLAVPLPTVVAADNRYSVTVGPGVSRLMNYTSVRCSMVIDPEDEEAPSLADAVSVPSHLIRGHIGTADMDATHTLYLSRIVQYLRKGVLGHNARSRNRLIGDRITAICAMAAHTACLTPGCPTIDPDTETFYSLTVEFYNHLKSLSPPEATETSERIALLAIERLSTMPVNSVRTSSSQSIGYMTSSVRTIRGSQKKDVAQASSNAVVAMLNTTIVFNTNYDAFVDSFSFHVPTGEGGAMWPGFLASCLVTDDEGGEEDEDEGDLQTGQDGEDLVLGDDDPFDGDDDKVVFEDLDDFPQTGVQTDLYSPICKDITDRMFLVVSVNDWDTNWDLGVFQSFVRSRGYNEIKMYGWDQAIDICSSLVMEFMDLCHEDELKESKTGVKDIREL